MVPMPMMPLGLTIWAIVRADEKDDRGGKQRPIRNEARQAFQVWSDGGRENEKLCGGNGESRSSLDS